MPTEREWFGEWFSSPYYHILYKNRNLHEANTFIDNLIHYLNIQKDQLILDLACGRGRHAISLNNKGFNVIGVDLSPENIEEACIHENDRLHFYVHDMRKPFSENKFDYILNLFTSFGYFETQAENEMAIKAAAQALKKNGKMLIDFLNPYILINIPLISEKKEAAGILFSMKKYFRDGFFYKDIRFVDNEISYNFQEKVKAIRRTEFLGYFKAAGLKLIAIFGNYSLEDYVAEKSERMIFLLEK